MSDAVNQATASFERWNAAFNARDMDAMIAEMHFPHRRLSFDNKFQVWDFADDFRESGGEKTTAALKAEGWDHTTTTSIEAVQSGDEKVHLAIHQSRRLADGTEYNGFLTLWIFTLIDGRWGVQFRSSFVSGRAQGIGGGR
ncbi:MAG: hypothetical protein QGG34_08340 [SAR202 cluster bacterium]|jgi:hypothetical protein|nr:hypothetical protein [SAR202 cluster bacterium]MDP6301948.1 hypothetical protein [SAR202 cluster bacterium]MDP7103986.1 hypothetical protein [SAR202 cluster bacterium]MDP7225543.1 hypothetical protein [SAR202 cluster bacterium]MDP7413624.1 hypothetical protein [SAR202 cluster bacterium]|tara:strand:+ start:653 stop:1075 length:423 start_codon:yes stop_codon:yes gene_type:complete